MIEIKLKDLINSYKIFNEIKDKNLPGRTAYKIARISREVESEYKLFQKAHMDLLNKYGETENGKLKIDDNGNCAIKKENVELFNKEVNELFDTVIQLNVDYLNLNEIENENFTIEQMYMLDNFIK